ncbi:hypothetical protein [Mucilaginibacter sp. OK098]|uniref:hypothetical protein n=1 Tax=Mucilaginibacter sp. OK098 TaxID=1855297 RepID=UPI000917E85C|nr:hypothetical protein [Mucilaginibacter sp. OK098]SHM54467.1 hypothetical protein SAMN05216524_102468 [Mucilaginibacter sp. OK098]
MKKPRQEDIPRSILKYNTVAVDPSFYEQGFKMLFLNPECVVVGLGDVPSRLFITPAFTTDLLPPNVAEGIHEVVEIVLQSTFTAEPELKKSYPLPKWLTDFKKVKHLKLVDANLDNLIDLKDLPVQHLVIEDIRFNDTDNLVTAIQQFKHLKYLAYDETFPTNVVEAIRQLNLSVTLLTAEDYYKNRLFDDF